jgi:hypothetical protein
MALPFATRLFLGATFIACLATTADAHQAASVSPIAGVHKPLTLITRADLKLPPRSPLVARLGKSGRPADIAQGQAYSIVMYGPPDRARDSGVGPVGFNNTGQIYGGCIVYSGERFFNFAKSTNYTNCSATSISDASSSNGIYFVGGNVSSLYDPNSSGFVAKLTADGGDKTAGIGSFESSRPDSDVYGVNAAGDAYLTSYSVFNPNEPQIYSTTKRSFRSLPPCLVSGNNMSGDCFQPVKYYDECPFGACELNGNGLILGVDSDNAGFWYIYNPSTNIGISVPDFIDEGESSPSLYVPQLSNYGLVAVATFYEIGSNMPQTGLAVYSFKEGAWIGVIQLAGCTGISLPISMNNGGEVLSYADCSNGGEYFTWDPQNGIQILEIPTPSPYTSIYPLGVNDKGQILISALSSTSPGTFWGVLNPTAGNASTRRKLSSAIRAHRR